MAFQIRAATSQEMVKENKNYNYIISFVAGYACRLLTPEMKLLICGEESLDVRNSTYQKKNKFEIQVVQERTVLVQGKSKGK